MKIIDYDIVRSNSATDLADLVVSHMGHGWQPYGNPYCYSSPSGWIVELYHFQAMVKYEEHNQ